MVTQRWRTQNRILKPLVVSGGKTFSGIHDHGNTNMDITINKFHKRPSDGFFYYLDEYEDEILCCFPDADDENQPDTETTLYLRDCQSEFENGDTFESIVAEVDPILRGYELKRKTDRSV